MYVYFLGRDALDGGLVGWRHLEKFFIWTSIQQSPVKNCLQGDDGGVGVGGGGVGEVSLVACAFSWFSLLH